MCDNIKLEIMNYLVVHNLRSENCSYNNQLFFYISEKFSHYDYGSSENLLRYHTTTPPAYDLSKITAPTYIIYSKNDTLVHPVVIVI